MPTSIENLVALSQTDKKLIGVRRSLTNLEKQIVTIRKPLDLIESEVKKKQEEYDNIVGKHENAKQQLQTEDEFITKLESQVPLIRTQKEFLAGKKQLEEARKRRGLAENELLENEIKQEESLSELKKLQEKFDSDSSAFKEQSAKLLEEKETATKDLEELKKDQEELMTTLDKNISNFYKRSQERGLFPIITPVSNKACGGCNTLLQPQLMNEMMSHPEEYRNCPFCYRIMYYIPEPETSES